MERTIKGSAVVVDVVDDDRQVNGVGLLATVTKGGDMWHDWLGSYKGIWM